MAIPICKNIYIDLGDIERGRERDNGAERERECSHPLYHFSKCPQGYRDQNWAGIETGIQELSQDLLYKVPGTQPLLLLITASHKSNQQGAGDKS